MELVSLYVDQVTSRDLSRDRARRYPQMNIYPTIADALTLGGSRLAVDGVLLIAEHGTYRKNRKGQKLYPRAQFFEQIVDVFRSSGRTVPVFSDKHLSYDWTKAKRMYDLSREMGFAFMAGSSLPTTYRIPAVDMPMGAAIGEAMGLGYGNMDCYDFHALETIQCMVERRAGGETGVRWVESYRGERFWEAHDNHVWPHDLFEAALSRSNYMKMPVAGHHTIIPDLDDLKRMVSDPFAYRYEHRDGLKCTVIMLGNLVINFCFAARLVDQADPLSTQIHLPVPGDGNTLANFFGIQAHWIEKMFMTGRPSYPVERTLLTTGLTAAGVNSLYQGQKRIDTPHLAIEYQPPEQSTFCNV